MPGSVENAAPAAVLPWSLFKAFSHAREFAVIDNEYKNGESQRSRLAETSRKSWRISKRLTAAELQALRDFYDSRKGPTEPFYFYDPWDTSPQFSYDPTGEETFGRYTVRFEGNWNQSVDLGRVETEISLVELA